MAEAKQKLSLSSWPPEGRTLGEIVEQMVGPSMWHLLLEITGERPAHFNSVHRIPLIADPYNRLGIAVAPTDAEPYIAAVRACLPLIDFWNAHLIAKGRRKDPLSAPIEIVPPCTGWQVAITSLERSIIMDPAADGWPGSRIYDLRFFSAESATTKVWVTAEARRLKTAGEIRQGINKRDFAKQLAKAGSANYDYIRNNLSAWGLWPVESIK